MAITLRQSAKGKNGPAPSFALAPLPGSLMLYMSWAGSLLPGGWTDLYGVAVDGFRLYGRIAQAGDPAVVPPPIQASDRWLLAEFPGVRPAGPLANPIDPSHPADNHPHIAIAPVHVGEILILAALWHTNTTEAAFVPDAGYTMIERQDILPDQTAVQGLIYKVDPINVGAYDPGVSTAPFVGIWSAGGLAWAGAGPGGDQFADGEPGGGVW